MSYFVAVTFFVVGFVTFGLSIGWATENKKVHDGVIVSCIIGVLLPIITLLIFCVNAHTLGTGYYRSEKDLTKRGIYRVDQVVEGVSDYNHVLVVRLLLERNLESSDLIWDRALFVEFKEMPPTPCFRVINAEESKYEEVEIAGVGKTHSQKSE